MEWHNVKWFELIFTVAIAVLLAAVLLSCTSTARQWKSNTSFDVGFGGETADVRDGYGYIGASYYLDYGVSTAVGLWSSPYVTWGPYWGINYSMVPFE